MKTLLVLLVVVFCALALVVAAQEVQLVQAALAVKPKL